MVTIISPIPCVFSKTLSYPHQEVETNSSLLQSGWVGFDLFVTNGCGWSDIVSLQRLGHKRWYILPLESKLTHIERPWNYMKRVRCPSSPQLLQPHTLPAPPTTWLETTSETLNQNHPSEPFKVWPTETRRHNKNDCCCLKPPSFGMMCYTAMDIQDSD